MLSTHILEEVAAVCTRAMIIAHGQLRFDGTPAELQKMDPAHGAVSLTLDGDTDAREALAGIAGVERVEPLDAPDGQVRYRIYPQDSVAILGGLSSLAHERGWEVDHLSVEAGRLDEVFRTVTAGGARS